MPELTCEVCGRPGAVGGRDHIAKCLGHQRAPWEQLYWCHDGGRLLVWTASGPVCEQCLSRLNEEKKEDRDGGKQRRYKSSSRRK